jgi:hypothetical protein
MRRRVTASLLLSALGAAALAGCGITDPYSATQPTATTTGTSTATVTNADPAPERGGAIPADARAAQSRIAPSASRATPDVALERYARLYVNWNARTVVSIQRQLAALSIGQARAQALQAAASYTRDQNSRRAGSPTAAICRDHPEPHHSRAAGARYVRADDRQRRLLPSPADAARHLRRADPDGIGLRGERVGTAELTSSAGASLNDGDSFARSRTATDAIRIALAYAGLWIITLLGAAIGTAVPALTPAGRPHPALDGSLGDFTSIAAINARILSAPFLMALCRFPARSCPQELAGTLMRTSHCPRRSRCSSLSKRIGASRMRWAVTWPRSTPRAFLGRLLPGIISTSPRRRSS